MSEPTKYASFVMPDLGNGRLDAQWARISERRPGPRRAQTATLPALGIFVAACAIGLVWWPRDTRPTSESVWEGSLVSSDESPVDMTLAEGTRIKVEPHSEVKLLRSAAQAVQVRLARGSARFAVVKRPSRRFSVNLGGIEVVVTGTQFRVLRRPSAAGERVRVEVEEGSVEVHRADGDMVTLHAGEHWSTLLPRDEELGRDESADLRAAEAPVQRTALVDRPQSAEVADASAGAEEAAEEAEVELESEADEAESEVDDAARDRQTSRAKRRRRARADASDAEDLFDYANLARRAGRLADAAELYAEVVARYPRDRRASLAAFELGRLRMDSLRDTRGAVQALERALKLDDRGEFAEDALARLVLAEEARGDRAACQRARARYLARYPDGVHAQHVGERCGH